MVMPPPTTHQAGSGPHVFDRLTGGKRGRTERRDMHRRGLVLDLLLDVFDDDGWLCDSGLVLGRGLLDLLDHDAGRGEFGGGIEGGVVSALAAATYADIYRWHLSPYVDTGCYAGHAQVAEGRSRQEHDERSGV